MLDVRTHTLRRAAQICVCGLALLLQAVGTTSAQETVGSTSTAAIQSRLEAKVKASPDDGRAWRLLGRIYLKAGRQDDALRAFDRAIAANPNHVAANFDYGRTIFAAGRRDKAAVYLKKVVDLAPESLYAKQANEYLEQMSPSVDEESEIQQAGFEVKRFDGSDLVQQPELNLEREPKQEREYDFRLEAGLLYNSNVALTPISRELAPGTRSSFQAFVAPEVEYRLLSWKEWTAGPAFAGYFNLNENHFRRFNLQNYQPAFFVERTLDFESFSLAPRIQYDYTHDEFDGKTFGNRHALTTSASAFWDESGSSFVYWSVNFTDFASDGEIPVIDSRDGWTNVFGLSHTIEPEFRFVDFLRAGMDIESVDADGSDFRYRGVSLYGEAESEVQEDLWLTALLGWGYRDYYDFLSTPSRNENVWRAGLELRKQVTDRCSIGLVFNYDRFDSKNPLFAADRYVGGVVTEYRY